MRTQGPPRVSLVGKTFGRLTVVAFGKRRKTSALWRCLCECGNETLVSTGDLSRCDSRRVRSCGCYKIERTIEARTKHGHAIKATRTYMCWQNMRGRCGGKNRPDFKHYGGRGIKVDERWNAFSQFLRDMGEMPIGFSLERIDVNGNYCPENCKWIPRRQQPDNTRKSVWLEYGGILWRPTLLARLLNMSADRLRRWAKLGRKLEFEVERYKRLRLA